MDDSRRRINKKDEAIRRKIEAELQRKSGSRPAPRSQQTSRRHQLRGPAAQPGTVAALRPSPALTVPHHISISDASQLCAAKRTDCVLIVDDEQGLAGILTAKDLAFRAVADGLDTRHTPVSEIMSGSPMVTRDSMLATDALSTMVDRGFRHLPVCNDDGDVVGILNIAKVFYEALTKLERAFASSEKLYNAIEGVQDEWGPGVGAQDAMRDYVESLRDRMTMPDLSTCLDEGTVPCTVSVRTSVLEAARMMAEYQTTAVLVLEGTVLSGDVSGFGAGGNGPRLAGIFTSKDVVLRVLAAGLDPRTCSVVRVMTPHPDVAPPTMSIQDALRKMHEGRFLNLPVVDDEVGVIGVVDVLRLTWRTHEIIMSMQEGTQEEVPEMGGPMWSHFWNSFGNASYEGSMGGFEGSMPGNPMTESMSYLSSGLGLDPFDTGFEPPMSPDGNISSDVFPGDSASAVAAAQAAAEEQAQPMDSLTHDSNSKVGGISEAPVESDDYIEENDTWYLFKFTTPSQRVHRFQAPYDRLDEVRELVALKLAGDEFFTTDPQTNWEPSPHDFKLGFKDDDGDEVIITTDDDLTEAVRLAQQLGNDRITLLLFGGPSWTPPAPPTPAPASAAPLTAPTAPPATTESTPPVPAAPATFTEPTAPATTTTHRAGSQRPNSPVIAPSAPARSQSKEAVPESSVGARSDDINGPGPTAIHKPSSPPPPPERKAKHKKHPSVSGHKPNKGG